MNQKNKVCITCKQKFPPSSYYISGKGSTSRCKKCHVRYTVAHKKKNHERYKGYGRKNNHDRWKRMRRDPKFRCLDLLSSYRGHDLKEGRSTFGLKDKSKREYLLDLMLSNKCFYCGLPSSQGYTGLDRLDNEEGHTVDNCVPCCWPCNFARNDYWSPDEMLKHIGPAIRAAQLERESG